MRVITVAFVSLVLAGVALAAQVAVGGVTRPLDLLPDTSNGIHLFADQLSGGASDRLVRFAAAHYAGTQKLQKAENERYRALNPRWLLLHYRLGSSSGPVPYIHGNQWSSDWSAVTAHEDWFLHNEQGRRHHDPVSNWDIHDLRHEGFRRYWADNVIADMRAAGAQGVFADSFEAGVSGYGVTPPDRRFETTAPADPAAWAGGPTWLQQKLDFLDYVKNRFDATPERFIFVPNITLATAWWWPRYARADGAMNEGWALGLADFDWVRSMDRTLEMTRAGQFFIAQAYPRTTSERLFSLASYLLIKGRRTFINNAGAGVIYFPEYALDIGPPVDALPDSVQRYKWNGMYRREFQHAIVLVNPGEATVTATLPRTLALAAPVGGGPVRDNEIGPDGNYTGGSMTYRDLTSVTLTGRSAAILMKRP